MLIERHVERLRSEETQEVLSILARFVALIMIREERSGIVVEDDPEPKERVRSPRDRVADRGWNETGSMRSGGVATK